MYHVRWIPPLNNIVIVIIIIIIIINIIIGSSEEQSTVKHLQLDRAWVVRTISFFEKYLLESISVFLDLVGKGLVRSSWWCFPVEGLTQHVDVSGFIVLHNAQNVAKELELTCDDRRQQLGLVPGERRFGHCKTLSKRLTFKMIL